MDAFEFNKIAGAILSALLFLFGTKTVFEILRGSHGAAHHEVAYKLPEPKGGGGASSGAEEAKFDFAKFVPLLAKGNVDAGKDTFKKCATCHTPEKGGPNKVGPNLYGIVGRDIGKHAGFAYSQAMSGHGDKWTYEHLANYLHDPKGYVPGNKMAFIGISDNADLADLLAYLRTLSDNPVPLPQ
jgi:cytochrome c